MDALITLIVMWFFLSLVFPKRVSNPLRIIINLLWRGTKRGTRAFFRSLWYHAYRKQRERRGSGFAFAHLIIIWNLFATGIIIYALANPHSTPNLPDPHQAIPGLIIFWIFFFLYKSGYTQWKKITSPKRKLPGRRRRR